MRIKNVCTHMHACKHSSTKPSKPYTYRNSKLLAPFNCGVDASEMEAEQTSLGRF